MYTKIESYLEQFRGDPPPLKSWTQWAKEYVRELSDSEYRRLWENQPLKFEPGYVRNPDGTISMYEFSITGLMHPDREHEYMTPKAIVGLRNKWRDFMGQVLIDSVTPPPPPDDGEIISADDDEGSYIEIHGDNDIYKFKLPDSPDNSEDEQ